MIPTATGAISLSVNGETRQLEAPFTVARLVDSMALTGKRIALELNGEIVPRSQYGQQRLMEGDQLEIVVAVGGG